MADQNRVARWRQRLKDEGKKAITVWLTVEEELRLKDLATTWHTSPSEVMQRALAQFQPGRPPSFSNYTEATRQHDSVPTDTLQVQVQAWLHAELPGMVRQIVEQLAEEIFDRARDVANDVPPRSSDVPDNIRIHSSYVTDTSRPPEPPRHPGRQRSPMGQRILDLLAQHPEGLTAEQIRAALEPSRPLGDILAGMRKTGAVQVIGMGRQRRYTVKS